MTYFFFFAGAFFVALAAGFLADLAALAMSFVLLSIAPNFKRALEPDSVGTMAIWEDSSESTNGIFR